MGNLIAFVVGNRDVILSAALAAAEDLEPETLLSFNWLPAGTFLVAPPHISPYDCTFIASAWPDVWPEDVTMEIDRLADMEIFVDIIDPKWVNALRELAPGNPDKAAQRWRASIAQQEDEPQWKVPAGTQLLRSLGELVSRKSATDEVAMIWFL